MKHYVLLFSILIFSDKLAAKRSGYIFKISTSIYQNHKASSETLFYHLVVRLVEKRKRDHLKEGSTYRLLLQRKGKVLVTKDFDYAEDEKLGSKSSNHDLSKYVNATIYLKTPSYPDQAKLYRGEKLLKTLDIEQESIK